MTTLFLAQLLIPALLVLRLWLLPPRSHLGWAVQCVATLMLLAVSTRAAIWMFPPWWTPIATMALVLTAALLLWPRAKGLPWLPAGLAGWAVDLIATDALGLRTAGFMPVDPARYRIFGMPVLAPCIGTVVLAVDGLPDMPVPEYDRAHLAGNHVMLDCDGVHIALAHLKQGSVRVQVDERLQAGQLLGEVGNSGGSNEPHLHIHAQRAGTAAAPMGGEALPMLFAGRFLVRGDRVNLPMARP